MAGLPVEKRDSRLGSPVPSGTYLVGLARVRRSLLSDYEAEIGAVPAWGTKAGFTLMEAILHDVHEPVAELLLVRRYNSIAPDRTLGFSRLYREARPR